jgi:hypothetical protein
LLALSEPELDDELDELLELDELDELEEERRRLSRAGLLRRLREDDLE